jgi:hypothetical protein
MLNPNSFAKTASLPKKTLAVVALRKCSGTLKLVPEQLFNANLL